MTRTIFASLALTFLALASFSREAAAQITATCDPSLQATFDQCVKIAILDGNNQTGFNDPKAACASIANDQSRYYCCLCQNYQRVVGCFQSNCPGASQLGSTQGEATQYCQACIPGSNTPAPSGNVTAMPFPTLSGGPATATASGTKPTATAATSTSTTPLVPPVNAAATNLAGGAAALALGAAAAFLV
ncbi:hypothetical protein HK104_011449 [Borealophlyctis nickersoniae]|nr:hypothetical protein HK104_011449 [Borealophlyctis nickersoniae]